MIYVYSDCGIFFDRDGYIYKLMKYINIDFYGLCEYNKNLLDQ